MTLNNLIKAIGNKKLVIGTKSTIKALKSGIPKEVFVTKNCPEDIKSRIKNYSSELNIPCTELEETNDNSSTFDGTMEYSVANELNILTCRRGYPTPAGGLYIHGP